MNAMDKRYAMKDEPDSTIFRIEELEAMNEMLLNRIIKHEKSIFQNSTLAQMGNEKEIKDKIHEAVRKDRASSPIRRNASQASIAAGAGAETASAPQSELDKIMEEIDKLNENDLCLTTRVQILEKGLGAANNTLNVHTTDINALKNVKPIEMPETGEIDTSAIFKAIKAVETNLNSFKSETEEDQEKQWAAIKKCDNLGHELDRLRAEFEMHKNKDFKDLEARVA